MSTSTPTRGNHGAARVRWLGRAAALVDPQLRDRLDPEIENGRRARQALADAGISLQAHCERLLADGVKSFATAFDEMMAAIRRRARGFVGPDRMEFGRLREGMPHKGHGANFEDSRRRPPRLRLHAILPGERLSEGLRPRACSNSSHDHNPSSPAFHTASPCRQVTALTPCGAGSRPSPGKRRRPCAGWGPEAWVAVTGEGPRASPCPTPQRQ